MDIEKIQSCRDEVIRDFGKVDILLNAARENTNNKLLLIYKGFDLSTP